jgi:hypothetical protein
MSATMISRLHTNKLDITRCKRINESMKEGVQDEAARVRKW